MKRLLFCLLLLACTASGQIRRDSLRVEVLDQLGIPTIGDALVTVAKVNRIIDQGVREVSSNFPAIEKLDTVVIYPSTEGGALNSDFSFIRWAQIIQLSGDSARIPLIYRDPDTLYPARGGSYGISDAKKKTPEDRYYYTHANRLMLYSKFVAGEGDSTLILVAYFAVDASMTADTSTTAIAEAYLGNLMDWICYRVEYLRQRYDAGDRYAARYEKSKTEARPGK